MSTSAPIDREAVSAGRTPAFLGVNIGCGTDAPDGWYNIDNSPTILVSRVPALQKFLRTPAWPRNVRRHNVLKGMPFADATVDYIYSSHTFEHFTYAQSLTVAKDCFRILKVCGILRIAVPDLQKIVRDYLSDPEPLASHRFIDRLLLHQTWQDIVHSGAHHSQMFDARSLVTLFHEAGFFDAQVSRFGESGIPDIAGLELESRRGESLYVEAVKRPAIVPLNGNQL